MLDELDRELERRRHCFVRYADDCNIYVASEGAGKRVMQNVTSFLRRRLKLRVNQSKSAVARPQERKFLGFSFTAGAKPKRRIAPKALLRCKQRIRELTRRTRGISLPRMMKELASYLRGWKSYFGFCQTPSVLRGLEQWMRRRLRSVIWKQWRVRRTGKRCNAGVGLKLAAQTALSRHGPWRLANSPALQGAFPVAYFDSLGLPRLLRYCTLTNRTAVCGPACTVVWQGRTGDRPPYADPSGVPLAWRIFSAARHDHRAVATRLPRCANNSPTAMPNSAPAITSMA